MSKLARNCVGPGDGVYQDAHDVARMLQGNEVGFLLEPGSLAAYRLLEGLRGCPATAPS
jgi:hypothetical protein